MKRAIVGAALAAILFSPGAKAQLGSDIISGLKEYYLVLQIYQLGKAMSQDIKGLPSEFLQPLRSNWQTLNPSNLCATCAPLASAMNTGYVMNDPTFGGAVRELADLSQLLAMMDPVTRRNFQAQLANRIYLPQAAVNNDIAIVGQAQSSNGQMNTQVADCLRHAANDSRTEVSGPQAAAVCAAVNAQQLTTTNALLSSLVKHEAIRTAREIDEETERANTQRALVDAYNAAAADTGRIDPNINPLTGR